MTYYCRLNPKSWQFPLEDVYADKLKHIQPIDWHITTAEVHHLHIG